MSENARMPQTAKSVLSRERLETILAAFDGLRIGVIGDFSLDAYWYADMTRAELSREAPLFVRPVVSEAYSPGGAANAAWNVAALGAEAHALTLIGNDWRGAVLREVLDREGVRLFHAVSRADCVTPLFGKVFLTAHGLRQEDARLDFVNPRPPTIDAEDALIAQAEVLCPSLDAMVVADYNTQGVTTPRVRAALVDLAASHPFTIFIVDSRIRVAQFPGMVLKPNDIEAAAFLFPGEPAETVSVDRLGEAGAQWQRAHGRPIFVTLGPQGCLAIADGEAVHLAGVPVPPPVDPVGAGDTFVAALACSLAARASPVEAGALANLAASVSVGKLHITGTASPAEILAAFERIDGNQ